MRAVIIALAVLGGLGCHEADPGARAGGDGAAPADGSAGAGGVTGQAGSVAGSGGIVAGAGGGAVAGTGGAPVAGVGGGPVAGAGGAPVAGTGGGPVAGAGGGGAGGGSGGAVDLPCRAAWAGDVQAGTALDDQILGLIVDADDNVIASGYEQGKVGETNIEPDGNSRAVVVKYSPAGTLSWRAVLDTAGTDTAEDVAIDPATGALLVLGRTSGAFPTFTNQGQFDLVLATLDPAGQLATVFQTGNERPQHPARLSIAPGGKIAVAGWDDTYIATNYIAAQQDGFVGSFRIDPGPGHAVSQTALQYTLPPAANSPLSLVTGVAAETDGSGDVYVTSKVATNNSGRQGTFVTRLRPDHSVAWEGTISTVASDIANAVALSPSGDLFITGATALTFGPDFRQEDAFLIKVDKATGDAVWVAEGGGAGTDYPTALAFDPEGNIYVAGLTTGTVVDGVANQGSFDIFAMKFSPDGRQLAAWQRGTAAFDQVTSMAVDRCGRVFVAGFTAGAIVPGYASAGGEDMFVMKADLR